MKRTLHLITLFIIIVLLAAGCAKEVAKKTDEIGKETKTGRSIDMEKETTKVPAEELAAIEQTKADPEIAIMETSMGTIKLGFFPDVAPNHVARFKELAKEGFYDGILFHRVIPGFVIQGGDPKTKDPATPKHLMGTGGSGKNLKAEFNSRPHLRGTLSAARSNHPDSADSQFFICVARVPHLDNKYTVYGHVLEGVDVAEKIVTTPRDQGDNPIEPVQILSVKIEKR